MARTRSEQQFSPGIGNGDPTGTIGNKSRSWRIIWASTHGFEGSTSDDFETILSAIDPTADRAIKLPNSNGTARVVADVTGFGAVGDGVTDDSTAIQDAIDAVSAAGGGIVFFPKGTYRCLSGLTIVDGVSLIGEGWGSDNTSASQPDNPLSILSFESVSIGILIKSATSGNHIWGIKIEGLYIKGNNTCSTGVLGSSVRHCRFDFGVERFTVAGFHLDDSNAALSANNYIDFYFFQSGTSGAADDAIGLLLDDSGAGFGVTRTYANFINCTGGKDGAGVKIGNHDGGTFERMDVGVKAGGSGNGLILDGDQGAQPKPSRKNVIGFLNGDVLAEDNSRNMIVWINSEPSDVFINGTASLDYKVIDRNNGKRYQTARFLMSDYLPLELVGNYMTVTGAPADALTGGAEVPAVRMGTGAESRIAVTQPVPKHWDDKGTITTVDIFFNIGAGSGDIKFEVNSIAVIDGGGLGAAGTTGTVVVTGGTANLLDKATVTLSAVINSDIEILRFKIARLGAAGEDTFSGNVDVIGVKVNFEAAGPHTDADAWAIPADEV